MIRLLKIYSSGVPVDSVDLIGARNSEPQASTQRDGDQDITTRKEEEKQFLFGGGIMALLSVCHQKYIDLYE